MMFTRLIFTFVLMVISVVPVMAGTGEGVRAWMATDAIPVEAGKPFLLTIALDLQPGWHTYWQYPGDSGIPTKVEWELPEGWKASPLVFSVPEQYSEPGDMVIYGYEKQQLLRSVITPPKDLPKDQVFNLKAKVSWLACKELCVPGSVEVSVRIWGPSDKPPIFTTSIRNAPVGDWPWGGTPPVLVSISGKGTNRMVSFTGNIGASYELFPDPESADATTVGHVNAMVTPSERGPIMLYTIPWDGPAPFKALLVQKIGDSKHAWFIREYTTRLLPITLPRSIVALLLALFSGFLGGMILNLMPCVLPVISLKIFSFIAQAGESPAKIFRHGLAFAAGIFVWFLGLGVLVIVLKSGGTQVTWGAFQFQNPLFVIGLSVLVFLFALNLFGVFEITLSGKATTSLDHAAQHDGYSGSFFQGLFATLLATPCTAPFLGSALGFAFGQSTAVILAKFGAVALGMSFPYLLLSARPGWRRFIPKPGVWMERLKQFMGFPLLATNLWLLWVLENQRGMESALLLLSLFLILGFFAWIYGNLAVRGFSIWLLLVLVLAIGSTIFGVKKILATAPVSALGMTTTEGGLSWVPYTPAALTALRTEGKPVLLDFTATWCLTCQFNERTAINVPAVRKLLGEKGITAMKGDWTNADPAITTALKSFGRVGVPLSVYYPAGKEGHPVVLPELLTENIVLQALEK